MTGKPKYTLWLALNKATKKNGCLKVIEGSHKYGVIGDGNNLLDKKLKKKFLDKKNIKFLELKPGEAIIFSNFTLHGSNKNKQKKITGLLRVLNHKIKHKITGKSYPKIYGKIL